VYVAFEVAEGDGHAAVQAMQTLGIVGMSVTMPHKRSVAEAVDELTPQAAALGSCNTLFRMAANPQRIVGDSTDGEGFVRGLAQHGCDVKDQRIVVLGAGGAGRAVVDALGRHGAADVAVINRDRTKAESAAELCAVARVGSLADIADADVLVNATSVGMHADNRLPIDPELLHPRLFVNDLIYSPLETPLMTAALQVGAQVANGLAMLVQQAALQFSRWTNLDAPIETMQTALVSHLQQSAS
jgi:shikimate dehydrogenase